MHIFTTTKDGFKQRRRQMLISLICIYLPIPIILIYILPYDVSTAKGFGSMILTVVMVTVALLISAVSVIRRQKKIYDSFRLIVNEDSITREQHDTPPLTIGRDRIKGIQTFANGVICIIGESKLNPISIPAQVENRQELKRILSEIKPLTEKKHGLSIAYLQILLAIAAVGILFFGMASEHLMIADVSSLLLFAVLVGTLILIQRGKNFDKRTKRMSYIGIIPALAIISHVIIRWMNG